MTAAKSPSIDNQASGKGFLILILGVLVAGLGLVAFIASTRDVAPSGDATAPVEIEGDPLSPYGGEGLTVDAAVDPEIGSAFPTLKGTDFNELEIVIENDGRPKAIYYLAHWCPHCAVELPKLVAMMEAGDLPDEVDLYAINTAYDPTKGNPPSHWFHNEDFTKPVLRDDDSSTLFVAGGGRGFPYAVYVGADGNVVGRSSGEISEQEIASMWNTLAATADPAGAE